MMCNRFAVLKKYESYYFENVKDQTRETKSKMTDTQRKIEIPILRAKDEN